MEAKQKARQVPSPGARAAQSQPWQLVRLSPPRARPWAQLTLSPPAHVAERSSQTLCSETGRLRSQTSGKLPNTRSARESIPQTQNHPAFDFARSPMRFPARPRCARQLPRKCHHLFSPGRREVSAPRLSSAAAPGTLPRRAKQPDPAQGPTRRGAAAGTALGCPPALSPGRCPRPPHSPRAALRPARSPLLRPQRLSPSLSPPWVLLTPLSPT